MSPEEYNALALREQSQVFDRMFGAVEKVRERLTGSRVRSYALSLLFALV